MAFKYPEFDKFYTIKHDEKYYVAGNGGSWAAKKTDATCFDKKDEAYAVGDIIVKNLLKDFSKKIEVIENTISEKIL